MSHAEVAEVCAPTTLELLTTLRQPGTIHLYLHKAIRHDMGPFHLRELPPSGRGFGVVCADCLRRFKDWKANFIALASSSRRCPSGSSEKQFYSFIHQEFQ